MSGINGINLNGNQRPGPLDLFSRTDSDKNGGISQTELKSLAVAIIEKTGITIDTGNVAFEGYDRDASGSLSGEELRAVLDNSGFGPSQGMQGVVPPPPPPQQAAGTYNDNKPESEHDVLTSLVSRLQDLLDTLKGGVAPRTQGQPPDGASQDIFGKADSDRNGSLSQDELEVFAKALKESTGQTLDVSQQSIRSLDRNGDGQLSPEEVDLRKSLSLNSADLNGDSAASGQKSALDRNWAHMQQANSGAALAMDTQTGTVDPSILLDQVKEIKSLLHTLSKILNPNNSSHESVVNVNS